MVNYYLSLRQAEENRNKEDNSIRILYKQIDGLKQEIKAKDQINNELKKEIQKKMIFYSIYLFLSKKIIQ